MCFTIDRIKIDMSLETALIWMYNFLDAFLQNLLHSLKFIYMFSIPS